MSDVYSVPGVYVTENSGMSLSIQRGETAVPVFLGFFSTKKRQTGSTTPSVLECERIESWLDFTQQFGPSDHITVNIQEKRVHATSYAGANSIRLYFENGGGPCYVLNIIRKGHDDIAPDILTQIVPAIELCPDITLLCWCEFVTPKMDNSIYAELGKLLAATETSGGNPGRFLLADAWPEGAVASPSQWEFRAPQVAETTQVASYFPALLTGYVRDYSGYLARDNALPNYEHLVRVEGFSAPQLAGALGQIIEAKDTSVSLDKLRSAKETAGIKEILTQVDGLLTKTLPALPTQTEPVVLRASVAMAGVYARVDRERGVWKAPANVALVGVTELVVQGMTKAEVKPPKAQEKWPALFSFRMDDALNSRLVDARINAIRMFRGQGTVVWGARTMSPPEKNDWRYVPVRRLFNTIERDARAVLRTVVFEPNSPIIWEQIRSALDHYLNALWRKGGLQGDTPVQAYYVQIGLGTTMNKDDIDNGRMIVKIGVAAVRPAEFIVLMLTQDVIAA